MLANSDKAMLTMVVTALHLDEGFCSEIMTCPLYTLFFVCVCVFRFCICLPRVATLVNGIGARRILSQGSGKFRLNFHGLPVGRVSLHNELALESNVTDVESKEFAKHLEDRMRCPGRMHLF